MEYVILQGARESIMETAEDTENLVSFLKEKDPTNVWKSSSENIDSDRSRVDL